MNDGETTSARFEALLGGARPPTGGVDLKEIAFEVAPVFPLLSELPAEERAGGDYESFEFRECFAVLTLLGRRLALLDLTPTAAVQIVLLALRAVEGSDAPPSGGFTRAVVAAAVEGFVLGREERVAQTAETRAAPLDVVPQRSLGSAPQGHPRKSHRRPSCNISSRRTSRKPPSGRRP